MFELIFVLFCYIILFFLFLYIAFSNYSNKVKAPFYLLFILLFTYVTYVSTIFMSNKNKDDTLFYIFQRFFFIYGEYILIILGSFIVCIVLYKIFMGLLVFSLTQSLWAIIIIILFLALIQNVFYKTEDDGPLVTLIKDIIFYIPCFITDSIDFIKKDYAKTPSTTFIVFILIVIFSIIFFVSPLINLDGGHLLMSGPENLNTITVISTEELLALDNKTIDEWKTDMSYNVNVLVKPPSKTEVYPSDKLTKEIVDKSIENFSEGFTEGFTEGFSGLVQQDTNRQFNFTSGGIQDISINNFDIKELYDEQSNKVQKYLSKIDSAFKSFKDLFKRNNFSSYTPYTYNYGLSFWLYINTFHFKKLSSKPQKILTFGEKLSLLYDSRTNEFMVLLQQDEVYRTKGILFQRWNHIVVNSEDSKIDLFVNNNLVGTYKYTNIIPKIQFQNQDESENINQIGNVSVVNLYDTLNIGSKENINFGSICNFRYYNTILDLSKIKSIYTKYNKKNPPL